MKYCVNSSVALAAANLVSPRGAWLESGDGLSRGCCRVGCVPCLGMEPVALSFPSQDRACCPSPGSCFGWKTCGVVESVDPQTCVFAVVVGLPLLLVGIRTAPRAGGSGEGVVDLLVLPSGCSCSAPVGPPHPCRVADPALPPARHGWREKEYSLSLFE